ncbi:MAG: D-glycero-beta-D-manno-heptose 1,7-bisphosphate 7-phosphatase [Chloroflexi bacterium]|nr:D-glycero-beta-D-manno-heptose 1,7-bisphosphate 7-phosphatase [Chloroflexota bacterium]
MLPAIFLDRDGVINHNRADYVKSWDEFVFLPGALTALQRLGALGWPIIVITNQSAVGRGLVTPLTIEIIHANMVSAITRAGGHITDVCYCPHHPNDGCPCRKPRPGLLLTAARRWNIDLANSYFVGDAMTDILAAHAVGIQPILVQTGRGRDQLIALRNAGIDHFHLVPDLPAAVDWLLDHESLIAPKSSATNAKASSAIVTASAAAS